MSFLRMRETSPVSVADITASVEDVAGKVSTSSITVLRSMTGDVHAPCQVPDPDVAESAPHAQGQVLFVRLYDAAGTDLVVGDRHRNASARVQALSQVRGCGLPNTCWHCFNDLLEQVRTRVVASRLLLCLVACLLQV